MGAGLGADGRRVPRARVTLATTTPATLMTSPTSAVVDSPPTHVEIDPDQFVTHVTGPAGAASKRMTVRHS